MGVLKKDIFLENREVYILFLKYPRLSGECLHGLDMVYI